MPVVVVTGPQLADEDAAREALVAINRAIATGLRLRPEDVYATFTPAGTSVLGERAVQPWPIVLIHGSAREPERMDEAMALVRKEICRAWAGANEHAWVQWILPA